MDFGKERHLDLPKDLRKEKLKLKVIVMEKLKLKVIVMEKLKDLPMDSRWER
jgi:hypothetical protein